ncbi:MAG: long-chain-fatty-acid--CoA ligase [Deltaproteobacteria bacterium]|nr:long-chain-fatty-acid--CoA ligase [Deltaproteobacteria bacterium]
MEQKTYPQYSSRYPLLITNFMERPLNMYPDDVAIVYRNDDGQYFRFTWREWYARTCQHAHLLKALGVKEGDRVGTMALNHHRHLENIFATVCTGAISHPINIRLSLEHMTYVIKHAEDTVIFFDEVLMPFVELLYDQIKGSVKKFVYMSDKPGLPKTKIEPLYEYEALLAEQPTTYDWPELDENTLATLYYTTGTTGLPKGALYTHRQVYLQCIHTIAQAGNAVTLPDDPPRPNLLSFLTVIPFFHIHAWGVPFMMVYGCSKMVFSSKYTPDSFCELIQTEKVNGSVMVPTMLAMLLEYPDLDKWDLSSLINIAIGGGALPLGLKKKAEKLFPHMKATSGYGMSETMAGVIGAVLKRDMADWPKEEIDKVFVKTGLPMLPGIVARVVDENYKDVPHDNETMGEIILRGHWITEQYYKDPEKTATAWRDGWFHTGDAAKIDQDGYIIIADRITDVIRSGSEMVPTVLLENLTSNAEFVLEATYVGIPDEKWGEIPMALIKKMPGSDSKEEDILTFLQKEGVDTGKITKWMLPVYVAFVDDVPKTSVGKYDKIAIRKQIDAFKAKAKQVRVV